MTYSNKNYFVIIFALLLSCSGNNTKENAETPHHSGPADARHARSYARLGYADSVNIGLIANDTLKRSPHTTAMANIAKSHIHIEYGSPGVKNRIIWGQLVPYGQVWVTGANKETTIDFSRDVHILGRLVAAGTYSFYTIPGKEKWIAILRSQSGEKHETDYRDQKDELRFELTPVSSDTIIQRLRYSVIRASDSSGSIDLEWEKIRIRLPVSMVQQKNYAP